MSFGIAKISCILYKLERFDNILTLNSIPLNLLIPRRVSLFLFRALTMWQKMVYHRTGEVAPYFRRLKIDGYLDSSEKTQFSPETRPARPCAGGRQFQKRRRCAESVGEEFAVAEDDFRKNGFVLFARAIWSRKFSSPPLFLPAPPLRSSSGSTAKPATDSEASIRNFFAVSALRFSWNRM